MRFSLRTIISAAMLLSAMTLSAQQRDFVFDNNARTEGMTIENNTRAGLQMRHALKELHIVSMTDNGYTGDIIQGGMGISLPANEGEPSLPAFSRFVAVPNGATAHVEMGYRSVTTVENVDLMPAAPIKADTDDSPNTYEKKRSVYDKDAFFPEQPVTVSAPFSLRGVQTVAVTVVPYQYNPVTKELRIYDDLQFGLRFDGGDGSFGDDALRSPYWDPILMQNLANYDQLPVIDYEARMQRWISTRATGCEYLIVIPNNESFRQYANQLAEYRIKQGILTQVKSLSEMGCTTIDEMKAYFHYAYNTWDIRPVAVLLLGDHNNNMSSGIPAEAVAHPSMTSCISDNGYADATGDGLPDMVFSRLVAANASEAQMMVSKQIEYEYTNPNMEAASYDHPITALGWQTDRWFQLCSEVVGGYWRSQGKHPVRINAIYSGTPGVFWSSNDFTPLVVNYFGPSGVSYIPSSPAELGGWEGGTAAQVVSALNSGAMMLQHRDHGVYTGWGAPNFNTTNVAQLTNVGKLAFINTINCKTGTFNYSTPCLIEAFMRHTFNSQNAGAVGCIGPTETSFSFVNDTYAWGMYDQFDPQFLPDFGPFANYEGNWRPAFGNVAGKYFLEQSSWPYNTSQKDITYKMFTAHCDAFLTLYTQVPTNMSVSHPTQITSATNCITVSATAGAIIALTNGNQILAVATASGSNQTIGFAAQPYNSTLTLTCTKQDHLRYIGTISVVNGTSFEIGVEANPEAGGEVEGTGNYAANTECVIIATENSGYEFTNWTIGDTVVSNEAAYSFTVTEPGTYIANFSVLTPHEIHCASVENGSLSSDKTNAYKNEIVTLAATPAMGYCLYAWDVRDANNNSIPVDDNRFVMPNTDVTVSATFVLGNVITLSPVEHGSISATHVFALPGTIITLATIPDTHYCFDSWHVTKTGDETVTVAVDNNQFVMPDYDVTVGATFGPGYHVTLVDAVHGTIETDVVRATAGTLVTLSASGDNGYALDHWLVFKSDDVNTMVSVAGNQFQLPEFDVIVVGFFKVIPVETVEIGLGGIAEIKYLPTYSYYRNSLTQQIYTAEEIDCRGTITAIAFKVSHLTTQITRTRNLDIYLIHTDKDEFEANLDWVNIGTEYRVFSGNVTFSESADWVTIVFNTPFEYNGIDNLLLCVDDNTGSGQSPYLYFNSYVTAGKFRSVSRYSTGTNFDPSKAATYTVGSPQRLAAKNQIILTMTHDSSNELLTVSPGGLSNFTYPEGEGPSPCQSLAVIGQELENGVTLTAPAGYELCSTADGEYGSALMLSPDNGDVLANVYVRLKEGLSIGLRNESLALSSGSLSRSLAVCGEVYAKLAIGPNWWTPTKISTLAELQAALGTNGSLINSQDAGFVRYDNGLWAGTLTDIVPGRMYKIEANSPSVLAVSGDLVTGTAVSITPGNNWFGYLGSQPATIADVLGAAGFNPAEGDTISSPTESATFDGNQWHGTLTHLQPGHGYVYYSNDNETKSLNF